MRALWKQVTFGSENELVGIIQPATNNREKLVITLSGLGQAMSEKNYLFSNLRKEIEHSFCSFIQFDYTGYGDSKGELGDASVITMVNDTLTVIASELSKGSYKEIILVGNKLGAIVALLVTERLKDRINTKITNISISPPFNLPKSKEIFDKSVLGLLKAEKKMDSSILVKGEDYYTLSDFKEEQYNYLIGLGAHMLYIHGQCLSYDMIKQIDNINIYSLYRNHEGNLHVILGDKDKENINKAKKLNNITLHFIPKTQYYFQDPQAMDDVIDIIITILKRGEKNEEIFW